jgi:SAM-dependent methyltransferase
MKFQDNFSRQAQEYARYRPQYPSALFDYLASLTAYHELAWDCATGNGQAAWGLAPHFDHVIATDASASQIDHAIAHPKIAYRVAAAEHTDLSDHSADLITIAQALHWFDFDAFYAEVRRVIKPGGVLAAWCYNRTDITPQVDRVLKTYGSDILRTYWASRIAYVSTHYTTIPFPFAEAPAPIFNMQSHWDLSDLINYLNTWSAAQTYIKQHGQDPLDLVRAELAEAWGAPEQQHIVNWALYLRVGRLPST